MNSNDFVFIESNWPTGSALICRHVDFMILPWCSQHSNEHFIVCSSCTFGKPTFDTACTQKYNAEAGNSTLHIDETREHNPNFRVCNYGVLEDWPQLGQLVALWPPHLEADREQSLGSLGP